MIKKKYAYMEIWQRTLFYMDTFTVRDYTSNRINAPVLTLLTRGELLYVEPNAQFEEEMKRYYRF